MLPIPEILIALGFYFLLEKIPQKARLFISVIYIMIVVFSAENYLVNYFTNYRTNYSFAWQYGYKEAVNYANDHYGDYDKIIITKKYGEPHEFFLFFMKYDPEKYIKDPNAIRFFQSDWYWVDRFDKFYFVNDWQIKVAPLLTESRHVIDCAHSKCLLITSPDTAPTGWNRLQAINFLNGNSAFEIYAN